MGFEPLSLGLGHFESLPSDFKSHHLAKVLPSTPSFQISI
jgi:hypothetical protein